jgi:hypothetical protein
MDVSQQWTNFIQITQWEQKVLTRLNFAVQMKQSKLSCAIVLMFSVVASILQFTSPRLSEVVFAEALFLLNYCICILDYCLF